MYFQCRSWSNVDRTYLAAYLVDFVQFLPGANFVYGAFVINDDNSGSPDVLYVDDKIYSKGAVDKITEKNRPNKRKLKVLILLLNHMWLSQ